MKILFYFLFLFSNFVFAQKEANQWPIDGGVLLDFNSGSPVILNYAPTAFFFESNSCVSDENGQLLIYSNGDTIKGANHQVLPNGAGLTQNAWVSGTVTQGSVIVQKPQNDSLFYLFTLVKKQNSEFDYIKELSYREVLNGVNGQEVSPIKTLVCLDTLSEKMQLAQHCDGKNLWLVLVKYKFDLSRTASGDHLGIRIHQYNIEFVSYLITENGLNPSPVHSRIKTYCPDMGQLKLNNVGNEFAFGGRFYLDLFSFDNSNGKVAFKRKIEHPWVSSYGIEYSSDDQKVFVNNHVINLSDGSVQSFLDQEKPSILQRGPGGKIYSCIYNSNYYSLDDQTMHYSELYRSLLYNDFWAETGIPNLGNGSILAMDESSCDTVATVTKFGISLPNIPGYLFNQKTSDFYWANACADSLTSFFRKKNEQVDSLFWSVDEGVFTSNSDTAVFTFPSSGEYQVSCTVYQNGIATTSFQCFKICGANDVVLPKRVDLCQTSIPFELNAINTCSSSYLWNTGDSTSAIQITGVGQYILQTNSECGVFSDTMEVFRGEDCQVFAEIPNVITTNNDLINEFFLVKVKNAKSVKTSIFNRWGNLMHEKEFIIEPTHVFDWNALEVWDGMYNYGNVSEGIYFYKLEFVLSDNSIDTKSGHLTVIREKNK